MNGTINVYIPRTADGELMTGPVPKGQRAVLRRTPHTDTRTFFDPLADRNLPGAIPAPKPKPFNPHIAPKGWRLAPVEPVSVTPAPVSEARTDGAKCPRCGRTGFRKSGAGLTWHVTRCAA
jgi:hypothetical protein